eukprot:29412-Pelagococcus_subviridis.AAC.4
MIDTRSAQHGENTPPVKTDVRQLRRASNRALAQRQPRPRHDRREDHDRRVRRRPGRGPAHLPEPLFRAHAAHVHERYQAVFAAGFHRRARRPAAVVADGVIDARRDRPQRRRERRGQIPPQRAVLQRQPREFPPRRVQPPRDRVARANPVVRHPVRLADEALPRAVHERRHRAAERAPQLRDGRRQRVELAQLPRVPAARVLARLLRLPRRVPARGDVVRDDDGRDERRVRVRREPRPRDLQRADDGFQRVRRLGRGAGVRADPARVQRPVRAARSRQRRERDGERLAERVRGRRDGVLRRRVLDDDGRERARRGDRAEAAAEGFDDAIAGEADGVRAEGLVERDAVVLQVAVRLRVHAAVGDVRDARERAGRGVDDAAERDERFPSRRRLDASLLVRLLRGEALVLLLLRRSRAVQRGDEHRLRDGGGEHAARGDVRRDRSVLRRRRRRRGSFHPQRARNHPRVDRAAAGLRLLQRPRLAQQPAREGRDDLLRPRQPLVRRHDEAGVEQPRGRERRAFQTLADRRRLPRARRRVHELRGRERRGDADRLRELGPHAAAVAVREQREDVPRDAARVERGVEDDVVVVVVVARPRRAHRGDVRRAVRGRARRVHAMDVHPYRALDVERAEALERGFEVEERRVQRHRRALGRLRFLFRRRRRAAAAAAAVKVPRRVFPERRRRRRRRRGVEQLRHVRVVRVRVTHVHRAAVAQFHLGGVDDGGGEVAAAAIAAPPRRRRERRRGRVEHPRARLARPHREQTRHLEHVDPALDDPLALAQRLLRRPVRPVVRDPVEKLARDARRLRRRLRGAAAAAETQQRGGELPRLRARDLVAVSPGGRSCDSSELRDAVQRRPRGGGGGRTRGDRARSRGARVFLRAQQRRDELRERRRLELKGVRWS